MGTGGTELTEREGSIGGLLGGTWSLDAGGRRATEWAGWREQLGCSAYGTLTFGRRWSEIEQNAASTGNGVVDPIARIQSMEAGSSRELVEDYEHRLPAGSGLQLHRTVIYWTLCLETVVLPCIGALQFQATRSDGRNI